MHIAPKSRRNIALFLLAFFGIHVFRYVVNYYNIGFLYSITEFLSAILVILWMLSIRIRILSKDVREQLLFVCRFLILYFIIFMARYTWVTDINVLANRILWDAYYVPMTVIPARIFLAAQCIGQEDTERVLKKLAFVKRFELFLCILFLTNQWHQLLVRNRSLGPTGEDSAGKGILYWVYVAWTTIFFLAAFITMMQRCKLADRLKYIWLPLLPIINGVVYFVLYLFDMDLKIRIGDHMMRWMNMGQIFAFMVIGFLESCIQIGVIGSNTGYDELFQNLSDQAKILDFNGNPVYSTRKEWPEENADGVLSEDYKVVEIPVSGGTFYYATDLSNLNALNWEIKKTTESIEQRNEYLKTEQMIHAEQRAIQERNHLYDKIREIIFPQVTKVKEYLQKEDDISLARAAVLTAYIKRRSNMELLAYDQEQADLQELVLALQESASYLDLCGMETVVLHKKSEDMQKYGIRSLIRFYEIFQWWMEHGLNHSKYLQILLDSRGEQLELKIRQDQCCESSVYGQFFPSQELSVQEMPRNMTVNLKEEDGDFVFRVREETAYE